MTVVSIAVGLMVATGQDAAAKGKRGKAAARAVPELTSDGKPNVQATVAIVLDADNGAEYFAKDADKIHHIASTTKIFVAMVARKKKLDLDALTEITMTDARLARGGARTRLDIRHKFRNIDLLRAMLIASDNRAPSALGRAVGLEPKQLVTEMNVLAKEIGLVHTAFTDPSGLNGNTSTAREMAMAMNHAMKDPVLAEIMGTQQVTVRSVHSRPRAISYTNTNKSALSQKFPVTGGKTGFTNEAGYCLLITSKLAGRNVVMVFLGTREKLTRYGDFNRVAKWLVAGGIGTARAANVGSATTTGSL